MLVPIVEAFQPLDGLADIVVGPILRDGLGDDCPLIKLVPDRSMLTGNVGRVGTHSLFVEILDPLW